MLAESHQFNSKVFMTYYNEVVKIRNRLSLWHSHLLWLPSCNSICFTNPQVDRCQFFWSTRILKRYSLSCMGTFRAIKAKRHIVLYWHSIIGCIWTKIWVCLTARCQGSFLSLSCCWLLLGIWQENAQKVLSGRVWLSPTF